MLLGLAALPCASLAQSRVTRIGFLGGGSQSGYVAEIDAIRARLRDLGYVEGRNLAIEFRWSDGDPVKLQKMAAELVTLNVDVLVTHALPGARAAAQATKTIPIVIADMQDPVAAGIVTNLARPGGNITGSTSHQIEIHAKRLELLKEAVPDAGRMAILYNANNRSGFETYRKSVHAGAKVVKVELLEFAAREAAELPGQFEAMAKANVGGAVIAEDPMLNSNATVIAALAISRRLPVSGFVTTADAGGLLGYGTNRAVVYGRVAYFVDRIVKGTKPGDIPFERATTFELIVNLKTAKALGITVPKLMLQRADRVIE